MSNSALKTLEDFRDFVIPKLDQIELNIAQLQQLSGTLPPEGQQILSVIEARIKLIADSVNAENPTDDDEPL